MVEFNNLQNEYTDYKPYNTINNKLLDGIKKLSDDVNNMYEIISNMTK